MSGRIETIELSPNNPSVIYAGMGSGGLWKSLDQGLSWKNIFKNQASFSIGDLAISNQDPNILWLGTGEQLRASRGYCFPGSGVYKSTDGGETWVHKGLAESHHIGRVVIDPINPDKIFVAVMGHFWSKNKQRGLFLTEDGGDTWANILQISDSVGVADIIWDPNNEILYASSWEMISGPNSGVYKSTDLGQNWKKLSLPIDKPDKTGRIGLSYCPAWPEIVYAIVDNNNPISETDTELKGAEIYRSDDFGESWVKTHKETLSNYGGFGWAFGDIITHPLNPDEVFILGVHPMRSVDGGKTFSKLGGDIIHLIPNRSTALHLDQHEFKILTGETDTWILGNDGGIFISRNEGKTWLHCNTIPTGEFYDASVIGTNPVRITGGTQDNSNIVGKINPFDIDGSSSEWGYVWLDPWSGGDGFTSLIDPDDNDWIYWESQNGHLNKKNMRTNEIRFIKPRPDEDENPLRNSWFTPYFISHFNSTSVYYAANKIYKSIDKGESWERISHDLTFSQFATKKSRSITRIAESPVKPGIIYAGTENGSVWVSRNDGIKWFEVSRGVPDKKVVCILPSAYDPARVYLIMKAVDEIDQTPYVFRSNNFGSNWEDISGDLPPVPVNCIAEDPNLEDLLIVGTDAGILCTQNEGKSWAGISLTLPTASVTQLRWMSDNTFLLAVTHGLGLFYCHFEPIQKFIKTGYESEAKFLSVIGGVLPKSRDYQHDYDILSGEPMMISWYDPRGGESRIDITDSNGKKYSQNLSSRKGLNQLVWNLIISQEKDETNYPLPEIQFPKAGKCTIIITAGDQSVQGEVIVREAKN